MEALVTAPNPQNHSRLSERIPPDEAQGQQGLQHKKEEASDKKHNVSASCLCGVVQKTSSNFSQNDNNNTMFLAIISAVASEPGATSVTVYALTELALLATATRTQLLSRRLHWIFWLKAWCYHRCFETDCSASSSGYLDETLVCLSLHFAIERQ